MSIRLKNKTISSLNNFWDTRPRDFFQLLTPVTLTFDHTQICSQNAIHYSQGHISTKFESNRAHRQLRYSLWNSDRHTHIPTHIYTESGLPQYFSRNVNFRKIKNTHSHTDEGKKVGACVLTSDNKSFRLIALTMTLRKGQGRSYLKTEI